MFLVVGMDGNNQILPIAFVVGKTKSEELKECIEDMTSLAIISDRVNSPEMVIQSVFLNAYHRLYCCYLLMNMRENIRNQERTYIFWEAAKAYGDNKRWARLCFPVVRYNIMTLNNIEPVNALSRDTRKLPITMLIDFFEQLCNNGGVSDVMLEVIESKKDVTEYAEKVIKRRINKSSTFWIYQIDQSRYEVTNQMKNGIVNLESHYCTCGK
uniref:MULE transposase domain-containing protein n=1 Tax=Lactuca sativa TaxID=4236 RepID=A0A9R1V3D9_LACSA|nr:hypothetical protein LSAT_V11C700345800 [Lactuca sativa]